MTRQTLRIFLASPWDTAEARRVVATAVETINADPAYRERIEIELRRWDDPKRPVPVSHLHNPQADVVEYTGDPADCDLLIGLFRHVFGSPLPEEDAGHRYGLSPDGDAWTGTEWEIARAMSAGREVWIYRDETDWVADKTLPKAERDAHWQQYNRVNDFIDACRDDSGSIRRGVLTYKGAKDLKGHFDPRLREWIEHRLNPSAATAAPLRQPAARIPTMPLPSERFGAIAPEERPSTAVHLAFATYGVTLSGDSGVPICASVCIVTDAPDRLRKALDDIRRAVASDALVPTAAKQLAASATLIDLLQSPGARSVALRALAVISFSAYLYYCSKDAFDQLSPEDRQGRLVVAPLLHRLSKKSEHIEQLHTRLVNAPQYLEQAVSGVEQTYHRRPVMPKLGNAKYGILENLASVVATVACAHLADLADGSATELFESLRTRIRFAENVATGEKHKRDVNPLP